MKQPDLGLKVSELRKERGFTQEQLAEVCEVTPRTIQRIEGGEVEPRAFTRNSLSNLGTRPPSSANLTISSDAARFA